MISCAKNNKSCNCQEFIIENNVVYIRIQTIGLRSKKFTEVKNYNSKSVLFKIVL